ncbi:MAG: hypothetical protein CMG74_13125 [Candidatus Marinimicrobia bacterium]|nr:hypothetical protein [Candidatus Neomarinimicrobiota bacterium]|tara:strand:+ start:51720 stop:52658 length:939 start_codon:yes stop_codon:yes gene_type:complete
MKKIFINPGWGRTAGTTLREMYGQHSQICTIARPWNTKTKKFIYELLKNEGGNYNHSLVSNMIHEFDCGDDKTYILSDENILDGYNVQPNTNAIYIYANRMKKLFEDPHIFLTLRNQLTWISSFYSNCGRVLRGVPKPFDGRHVELIPWLEWQLDNGERSFFDLIDYNKYVKMFIDIFGKNRVHIFLYEDFVNQKKDFISTLSSLMQIDEIEAFDLINNQHLNPQDSKRLVTYLKFREKFPHGLSLHERIPGGKKIVKKLNYYLKKGPPMEKIKLPDKWHSLLYNYYKEGNNELSKNFDIQEKFIEYGYPSL